MISPCDCDCHEYEQIPNKKDQRTYPNTQIRNNFDLEISELKSEIEERLQNTPDYLELESKFIQLENEVQSLSEEKLQIEYELRQAEKGPDKLLSQFQYENENLIKEIDERNLMIDKLYSDNNNLYSLLNLNTKDNEYLKDKLITQNNVLKQINKDRNNLQNNLNNLSNLQNQDFSDIQNLKAQIDILSEENMNNEIELNNMNNINDQIINEINDEQNMKIKLEKILEEKDIEIKENTNDLEIANDTIKRSGNELNNLNMANNEEEENINICDENLIKESQLKNDIINSNKQLSDLINEKE